MNRREIILASIKKEGLGLEIGPCHSPIAPKADGYNVHILDYTDRETLISNYTNAIESEPSGFISTITNTGIKFNTDAIEVVDYIWNGEPFDKLIGDKKIYDWVIASHVIEHTPDLVGFLNNADSVLKDDGVLSLAIPDKRFCFDHYRALSGLGQVIDSHVQDRKIHSPGQIAEHYLYAISKGGKTGWNYYHLGDTVFEHSLSEAKKRMDAMNESGEYHDIHAWCFTPSSFRMIIHELSQLGLINLKESNFSVGEGHEFYMTLSRSGEGYKGSRQHLLEAIKVELEFRGYNEYYIVIRRYYRKAYRFLRSLYVHTRNGL